MALVLLFLVVVAGVLVFSIEYMLRKTRPLGVVKPSKSSFALVTGSSEGIGRDIALNLARLGFNMILVARSTSKLEAFADEIRSMNVDAIVITQDLSVAGSAAAVFDSVRALNRTRDSPVYVEILVNNAGFGRTEPFLDCPLSVYRNMIQLNVVSVVELQHLFASAMVERKRGRIMNVASVAGLHTCPLESVYCGTKAFVTKFSLASAHELRRSGVGVCSVHPGATQTNWANVSDTKSSMIFHIPLFVQSPQEVAASAVTAMMNGKSFVITGFWNRVSLLSLPYLPSMLYCELIEMMWKPRHGKSTSLR